MPKQKSVYVCENCAFESAKWVGQCPKCLKWNTLIETLTTVSSSRSNSRSNSLKAMSPVTVKKLSEVSSKTTERVSSKIKELDRVLGGGFVPGQVILLSGEPGIGKSTILLQTASNIKNEVVYVSGEESPEQIKLRAERLGIKGDNLTMVSDIDVDSIVQTLDGRSQNCGLIIVDSIQTLTTGDLLGTAGSAGQVRESALRLANFAKSHGIPMVIVGHVTKEGSIAGPKVLEHLVDTVLYIEGDEQHLFRLLRTTKNRFGPVSEVGIFQMDEKGLREVANPSDVFLEERLKSAPGSCVTVTMEGYRPILFEVQALTSKTSFGYPKRTASGFNVNRLSVLVAVLEKRCGLKLSDQDVYINIAGGMKIEEYSADLAVCLAIYSSLNDKPLPPKLAAFGEVGLSGEVRKVNYIENRVKEAKKLGFGKVISPFEAKSVRDAINQIK
jgi:DNA repair protein RadA/Sms